MLKFHKLDKSINSYVFTIDGAIPPQSTITRKFKEYILKADVKRIRIHDLRHSHATMLINKLDAKPHYVMRRLGHSDVSITLNTYAHLYENTSRDTMNKLDLFVDGSLLKEELEREEK